MLFEDIIGQSVLKRRLIESVQEKRISPAQMFLGSDGSGNLSLAIALAQYVLCQDKQENDACGRCSSCMKMQKLIHPDVHFSFPVIKKKDKPPVSDEFIREWRDAVLENSYLSATEWFERIEAENKQGNISAEECHAMLRKLSLKSFEGDYKILIIWKPEYLGKEGNVLLKLFEEPPDETLIILVAENQDLILNTILSRLQITRVPPIEAESLQDALHRRHSLDSDHARRLARLADGNYHEALVLLSEKENEHASLFRLWMLALQGSKWTDLYEWIEEISGLGREQQKSFFQYALGFLHEVILRQWQNDLSSLSEEELRLASWMIRNFGEARWDQLKTEFEKGSYYIERNASPKMLFMKLSLSIHEMIH